jgi:glucose-6-phosphate isomerase
MTFITKEYLLQKESLFSSNPASKKLRQLSYNAIDLSHADQLTPERVSKYCVEACGFKLLFATEKVTEEVLAALQELAAETHAIEKMHRMQDGEIVNYVEHYPC